MDYEKTGSVVGPVWCMGFDGIAVGVRWVMMLYAIFLQNLPYSVGFCDVVLSTIVGPAKAKVLLEALKES